jgi:hypothetical protein
MGGARSGIGAGSVKIISDPNCRRLKTYGADVIPIRNTDFFICMLDFGLLFVLF